MQDSIHQTKLFVISAPSGAGKTTLVRKLLASDPNVTFSISYTTRAPRPGEEEGEDYFFVKVDRFQEMVFDELFLEHAKVFDNYYGTAKAQVQEQLARGKHVILEIDWQGARQIRKSWPGCVTIFVLPPSQQELERRLRNRRTDSDSVIRRRLKDSLSDISHWSEFDHIIFNDDLSVALGDLQEVIQGDNQSHASANPSVVAAIKAKGFH